MNIFQDTYQNRLKSWRDLRTLTNQLPIDQACVEIDKWWQQAPLINRHLHWNDTENWPDPWTLLSENEYCVLTRSLGICYTLLMIGIDSIELVTATDEQCEEHYLVMVGSAKYTLNYWPNSVLNTSLEQFSILRSIPIESIQNKIK
jgi:hypothetical protein